MSGDNIPNCPDSVDPKVWKKLIKTLPTGVPEELAAMSVDELEHAISRSEHNVREQEDAMRADETLAAAKERVNDLASAYRDAIKTQRAKQRFASIMIGEKGKA